MISLISLVGFAGKEIYGGRLILVVFKKRLYLKKTKNK